MSFPAVSPAPRSTVIGIVSMIVIAALTRLIPHPPNFSPIEAIALFSGAVLLQRRLALLVPIAALALSDLFLGFHSLVPVTYGCMALIALAGGQLNRQRSVLRIAAYGLTAATFFFVVSNFAVWAASGMYPRSAAGLLECYVAAIPFFHNQLAGVAVYSTLLFGGYALVLGSFRANDSGTAQA